MLLCAMVGVQKTSVYLHTYIHSYIIYYVHTAIEYSSYLVHNQNAYTVYCKLFEVEKFRGCRTQL